MQDDKYTYPGTNILINKQNIKDETVLENFERDVYSVRKGQLDVYPLYGNFDFNHFKNIHKFLFQDVYAWGGQTRDVNISKGNLFCLAGNIELYAAAIFDELKEEKYLLYVEEDQLPERLAYYLSEINTLHPFREGNGRAQRLFINDLAHINGYHIDYSLISPEQMISASIQSFNFNNELMTRLITDSICKISLEEQRDYITSILGERSEFLQEFDSRQEKEQNIGER